MQTSKCDHTTFLSYKLTKSEITAVPTPSGGLTTGNLEHLPQGPKFLKGPTKFLKTKIYIKIQLK